MAGHPSSELQVGDAVAVRVGPSALRDGPLRLQPRTRLELYRVRRKIRPRAVSLVSAVDPAAAAPFVQPLNAERLVKVDLPGLALDPAAPRRLVLDSETTTWAAWNVKRYSVDGRVRLRQVNDASKCEWVDLSQLRYRWTT